MLCSKCSNQVKPIVAVDIDGTLSQYHVPLASFAAMYTDRPPKLDWNGQGNFEDYLGLTRAEYRQVKLAFRQGGFKRWSPIFDGAELFMMVLRDLPAEIWITTTRPWNRLDNVDPDTQWWLERYALKYDHLLYDEDKYKVLGKIVDPLRVAMVIDDLDEMVTQAEETFPGALNVMVARRHNRATRMGHVVIDNFNLMGVAATKAVSLWHRDHDHG